MKQPKQKLSVESISLNLLAALFFGTLFFIITLVSAGMFFYLGFKTIFIQIILLVSFWLFFGLYYILFLFFLFRGLIVLWSNFNKYKKTYYTLAICLGILIIFVGIWKYQGWGGVFSTIAGIAVPSGVIFLWKLFTDKSGKKG